MHAHPLSNFFSPLAPSLTSLHYGQPLCPGLSYAAFAILKLILAHSTLLSFLVLLACPAHRLLVHGAALNSVRLGTAEQSELMIVQATVESEIETVEGFATPRTGVVERLKGR